MGMSGRGGEVSINRNVAFFLLFRIVPAFPDVD
jgi:hypothetical protein